MFPAFKIAVQLKYGYKSLKGDFLKIIILARPIWTDSYYEPVSPPLHFGDRRSTSVSEKHA